MLKSIKLRTLTPSVAPTCALSLVEATAVPNGSELKGSWPLKGSTAGGGAVEDPITAAEVGRELAEELLDMWEELPPEKGSFPPNSSSPVAGAEVTVGTDCMCVCVCVCACACVCAHMHAERRGYKHS